MRRIIFLLSVLLSVVDGNAQISQSTGRASKQTKDWKTGGIFEGKLPQDEILEKRTEYSKKFRRIDGQVDIIIGGPFHYNDASGAWQDIDLNIKSRPDSKFPYYNNENKIATRFAKDVNGGVELEYKNKKIAFGINTSISTANWSPAISSNKAVQVNGNIISYKNTFDNVDQEYEVKNEMVQHRLRFNTRTFFSSITDQFINIEELIELPVGAVLMDSVGKISGNRTTQGFVYVIVGADTAFVIFPSRAWDASYTGDVFDPRPKVDEIISVQTSISFLSGDRVKYSSKLPVSWLLNPNRIYPIVFDPTIGGNGSLTYGSGFGFRYPWRTHYWQVVSQSIYLQSDINIAGNITGIAYRQGVNNGLTNANARIQMQTTNNSVFSTTNFIQSGWQTCLPSTTLDYRTGAGTAVNCSNPSPQWRPINFSPSNYFNYNNTQNLIIETRFLNSSASSDGGTCGSVSGSCCIGGGWYYYTRSGTVMVHGRCDCTTAYPTGEIINNSLSPIIQLTVNPVPCTPPPTPTILSATAASSSQVNLTWGSVNGATSYDVYYSSGNCPWTSGTFFTNTSQTSTSVSGLSANTTYKFVVVSRSSPTCVSGNSTCRSVTTQPFDPNSYSITGTINGATQSGVLVQTANGLYSGISNASGNYTISGVPNGYIGSVSASKNGFSFSPSQHFVSATNRINKNFTATVAPSTITITNAVIPSWQREDDELVGSVSVNYSGIPFGGIIQLDLYINGQYAGTTAQWTAISTVGTHQFNFNLQPSFFAPKPVNGDIVGYQIIYRQSGVHADVVQTTPIIERKKNNENILFFNDKSQAGKAIIKIPIKWDNTLIPNKVKVVRIPFKSDILPLVFVSPEGLECTLRSDKTFPINNSGYCEVTIDNSNIESAAMVPGDFRYLVQTASGTTIDNGTFDLTKFGRISQESVPKSKVMIMVGGIFNEIEASVSELKKYSGRAAEDTSTLTYSVIENCRAKCFGGNEYSTWYIATGNANSIKRNGYDIAKGIEMILKVNAQQWANNVSDIILFCHSKGGLDVRAMLSGDSDLTESLNGIDKFDFYSSGYSNKVKKVLFIGTPHTGAVACDAAYYALNFLLGKVFGPIPKQVAKQFIFNYPGGKDLKRLAFPFNTIDRLQYIQIPSNIHVLNLAGYQSFQDWTSVSFLNTQINRTLKTTDALVYVKENEGIRPKPNVFVQLYQHDIRDDCYPPQLLCFLLPNQMLDFLHMQIHKSAFLSVKGSQKYIEAEKTHDKTNLEKIRAFIEGSTSYNDLTVTPNYFWSHIQLNGSVLSNARVYLKSPDFNNTSRCIGLTDENGILDYTSIFKLTESDSLLFTATGYDTVMAPVSYSFLTSKKLKAVLFRSDTISNGIKYAAMSLLNKYPITDQSTIQIKVTGANVNSYLISRRIDDTAYTNLNLVNDLASVLLDTGYNRIIIQYRGVDTVYQSKTVYYFPDSLMDQMAMDCKIRTSAPFIGAKLYVNNEFYCDVDSSNKSIKLVKGINELRFSKFGYRDTTFTIDSVTTIDLSMQIYSYSSVVDTATLDLNNGYNSQYWKGITLKRRSGPNNQKIIVKQFDDKYPGLGVLPSSRKFLFRTLNPGTSSSFQVGIILDQTDTPNKDSVYLLNRKTNWNKYRMNQTGVTEYEPDRQKIVFDSLSLSGSGIEEIALMKKRAPIMKSCDITMHSGETLPFSLLQFVTDPDSIKHDITLSTTDSKITISGYTVHITAPVGFNGDVPYTLTATHDFLNVSKTYNLKVIPPAYKVPNAFTPNKDGRNETLKPTFMGKLLNCRFTVYNRNGQRVFETTDCSKGWDGTVRGKSQPVGTFVWTLVYQFAGESPQRAKGSVVLIH